MIRCSIFILWIAVAITSADAGRYNKVLSVGDPAPQWTDLPGTDDAQHSLTDLADQKAVVVVFTCNTCPYAMDAEERVIALHKKYADQGVSLVAINVNKIEEDQMPAMKQRAKEKAYPFPYLYDDTQQIARDFGVKYTPEFFVIDQQRRIAYMGSFDDSPMGGEIKQRYVEQALDALLADQKPVVSETAPVGCAIRYERIRRPRAAAKP